MNIFPRPSKILNHDGKFRFTEDEKLYFSLPSSFANEDFAAKCTELWKNFTAGKSTLEIVHGEIDGTAYIAKSRKLTPEIELEGGYEYTLDVQENAISVAYDGDNGLIHAFMTILQLISPYSLANRDFTLDCVSISDRPLLKMRGMHLCVFPETTLDFLKKAITLCGFLKCTHIVLEFWGMYKFKFMPELSWSDAYTAEQVHELIKQGRVFGLQFIPMFNHMGHATQSRFKAGKNVLLDNAPEYEELFEPFGWTWNVRHPMTLEILKNVRRELCELFGEGEYFHIGCDEVYVADGEDDGLDPEQNRLFVDFVNSVADDLEACGRKAIMWGDMFLDKEKYPFPYCNNISFRCRDHENNLTRLSKKLIIADWQYNAGFDKTATTDFFAENRAPETLILSPWEGAGSVSAYDNIDSRVELAVKYGLLGLIGTTWNTIYNDPRNLIYAVCQMWAEDRGYMKKRTWEVFKCFGMHSLRKLLPSNGVRELSGWTVGELMSPNI